MSARILMLQKWSVLGEYSNRSFFSDFHPSLLVYRIQNTYILASAWNIVSVALNGFAIDGLADRNIISKRSSGMIKISGNAIPCYMPVTW
jgi:hypothetical protein